MQDVLERLKEGVRTFRQEIYPRFADSYKEAVRTPQKPHTLMITCADSRIDIETVTNSPPGELFITRNVGNIVPAYGEMLGGVSAVIEYAVSALRVQHVVICGHSDCGAMKGIEAPDGLEALPTVKTWLRNAHAAKTVSDSLAAAGETPAQALKRLTERNVLLQLQHLRTHPSVAGAMAREELSISGWVYDIGSGQVRIAEGTSELFVPVETGAVTP
ncbi:MAG TPA: carbonic anhydrase [Acidobacteriaceae bacterium]|jgi:carbonic anhydrase|nr:carbonic anhydrase [Acidobacteriaceae bacterium]